MIRIMCTFVEHRTAIVLQAVRANSSSLKKYIIVVMHFVVILLVVDKMSVV